MAWPSVIKKTAWGIGALSHFLLYQTSFMDVAVKVPVGVAYPGRPVDTRQSYFLVPSIKTDIFCVVLSMAMRMLEPLAPGADLGLASACPTVKLEHTLASSFQRMPALSQSALVSGWLGASAHTLAPSFQRMPALSQSALVSGWL